MDIVLIANEAIDSGLKGSKSGVICKMNIEKVYDHVNWGLLFAIMKKWVLGWVSWMRWCIFSACFSVLINGT